MVIQTKDFGAVEVSEQDIIHFPQGIYAFEDVKEYVVLKPDGENTIMRLQSVHGEHPRFIIFDPFFILDDYTPEITKDMLHTLKASSPKDISIFVIAVIPEKFHDATVNLKSPLLVNFDSHLGMQAILDGSDYSISYPIFSAEEEGATC